MNNQDRVIAVQNPLGISSIQDSCLTVRHAATGTVLMELVLHPESSDMSSQTNILATITVGEDFSPVLEQVLVITWNILLMFNCL